MLGRMSSRQTSWCCPATPPVGLLGLLRGAGVWLSTTGYAALGTGPESPQPGRPMCPACMCILRPLQQLRALGVRGAWDAWLAPQLLRRPCEGPGHDLNTMLPHVCCPTGSVLIGVTSSRELEGYRYASLSLPVDASCTAPSCGECACLGGPSTFHLCQLHPACVNCMR